MAEILTANPFGRLCICAIAYDPVSVIPAFKVILFLLYELSGLPSTDVAFLLCVINKLPQQVFPL